MKVKPCVCLVVRAVLVGLFAIVASACGSSDPDYADVASIAVTTQPTTTVAGKTVRASFRLMDETNRPFKSAGVGIDIELNKGEFGAGGTVKSETTDAEGVAHFEFTIEQVGTGYTLTATSEHPAFQDVSTPTASFDIIAANIVGIAVLTQPSTAAAGDPLSASFQLVDEEGHPAKAGGVSITIVLNKHAFVGGGDTKTVLTDDDGVAHFEFTLAQADVGYTLTATSDHEALERVSTPTTPFDITGAAIANIAVLTEPTNATAGDTLNASFQLVDKNDNALQASNVEITLTLNQHQFDDGSDTQSALTDDSGVAHFEFVIEHSGNDYILTATSDYETLESISTPTTPFEVLAGDVSADASGISGTDGIINDQQDAQITIELRDVYGNPIIGVIPEFTATGNGNTYKDCSATDLEGVSNCAMSATHVGLKTLHITEPVEVEGENEVHFAWDCDETSTVFGGGSGDTAEDPYRLCVPSHLIALADNSEYMAKYFAVARDIDMGEVTEFNMIGDYQNYFVGHFDGNHQRIKNLHIDAPDEHTLGLFSYVGSGGVLENIILEGAEVSGDSSVGCLVGEGRGTVNNSYARCSVKGTSYSVGGLVANNRGTINDSYFSGSAEGWGYSVGGLVGYNEGAINGSYSTGSVTRTGAFQGVGGLVGDNSGTINASYSTAHVHEMQGRDVGGLVGYNESSGEITGSHSIGSIDGLGEFVGGLVGQNKGRIANSYSTIDVSTVGEEDDVAGGLVGGNEGTIVASYASGNVEGGDSVGGLVGSNSHMIINSYAIGDVEGHDAVGGLVGSNQGTDENDISIDGSYSTGHVTGVSKVGGLVGESVTTTVSSSYWDMTTSGQSTSDGGAPLTTDAFAVLGSFAGWDFTDIWTMGTAPDGETRPILQWQAE